MAEKTKEDRVLLGGGQGGPERASGQPGRQKTGQEGLRERPAQGWRGG